MCSQQCTQPGLRQARFFSTFLFAGRELPARLINKRNLNHDACKPLSSPDLRPYLGGGGGIHYIRA